MPQYFYAYWGHFLVNIKFLAKNIDQKLSCFFIQLNALAYLLGVFTLDAAICIKLNIFFTIHFKYRISSVNFIMNGVAIFFNFLDAIKADLCRCQNPPV